MSVKKYISLILTAATLLLVLCSCGSAETEPGTYDGKKIGILTGSIFDEVAKKNLKDPQICYFNSNADLALALETGKIDAYVNDEPVCRLMMSKYPDQTIVRKFADEDYAFIFKKDDPAATAICSQMNAFLAKIKNDGTLKEIDRLWFGTNENIKNVNMDGLTGENGTLSFVTTSDIGAPFAYMKDNAMVGYDVDIAVRFCREYGYGIKISNTNFSGMIADVSSGKCNFGAACITVTPERKESMLFSDADYSGGSVLVARNNSSNDFITSIDQLAGTKTGVQTGTIMDIVANRYLPDTDIEYYDTSSELSFALESGKIKSYVADEPVARTLMQEYPYHRILSVLENTDYAFAFPKSKAGSVELCSKFNEFLRKCKSDGTINEIDSAWFGKDTSVKTIDKSGLTGENGTLTMAVCSYVGKPFCYMSDGEYVGYDIDIAVRFCRQYGYKLNIVDYDASGFFNSLANGKCDFGASGVTVYEERKENMIFSDPDYVGGSVVVVNDGSVASEKTSFFESIKESFNKTFIRENRYKLFLSGILTTLTMIVLSLVFGSLLGFFVYYLYYRSGKIFRAITDAFGLVNENTPVVVILMILYYIVFGSIDINGVIVAVIGFTFIFACSVIGLLKMGVGAVDIGQKEAALALGYTETKTFFKVILPQAALHILPGYSSAIVQLIKATAIVGYIAVQDLTKVSEIIRSRTYEAFFPLISTAIIYFSMALLLTALIRYIERKLRPSSRKKIGMLKGVRLK